MLVEISGEQLAEWQVFEAKEGFSEERDDWRFSRLCFTVANMLRYAAHAEPLPMTHFLPRYGDAQRPAEEAPVVSAEDRVKYIERVTGAWCRASNAARAEAMGKRAGKRSNRGH